MPKTKFTAVTVKNLMPCNKSVEYFDTGREKGAGSLGLRVSPRGKKTWFLMYTVGTKVKRFTLGCYPDLSLKGARHAAIKAMARVSMNTDPQQERAEYRVAQTFSELWADYILSPKFLEKSASGQKEEQRKYDKLLKNTIGPMKVQDIRIKHLSPVLDRLAMTAPVNANRLYALLSFVFKFALNKGLIEQHPMYGMDKPGGKETPRKRHLTHDEIALLWPHLNDIFRLILLTAQRPGEVMAMERGEIDLKEKTWTIPAHKTKTKNEHIVPLSVQALKIIEPLLEQGSRFLFPSRNKSGHIEHTAKARYRLWSDLDIPKWTAHDLRRTARTVLSRLGVGQDIAERILNHARGKMEATYDQYSFLKEKRSAIEKLGREIARITGNGEKENVLQIQMCFELKYASNSDGWFTPGPLDGYYSQKKS